MVTKNSNTSTDMTSPGRAEPPLPSAFSPRPFGDYLLVAPIGGGGMAEIFLAERVGAEGFSRELAIKRILPHLSADPEFVAQFVDEAKLVSTLVHPNIVQIFELGIIEGQHFIAMELIRGADLGRVLNRLVRRGEYLPVPIAVYIISEILRGLDFAHTRCDKDGNPLHLVHRDISPTNILISFRGEVKVCDFGIAKVATSQKRTEAGTVKGKVRYLPPEAFVTEPTLDSRADIFAVGLVFYEVLSSKAAIPGDTPLQMINAIVNMPLPPPSASNPAVPAALDAIVAKAAAKKLNGRYQTAAELLADLNELVFAQNLHVTREVVAAFVTELLADHIAEVQEREKSLELSLTNVRDEINRIRESTSTGTGSTKTAAPPSPRRGAAIVVTVAVAVAAMLAVFGGVSYFLNQRPCRISVTSTPAGAHVLIDGRDTGSLAPTEFTDLEAGPVYEISCRRDGYLAVQERVATRPGGAHVVVCTLPEAPAPAPAEPAPVAPQPEPSKPAKPSSDCRSGHISVVVKGAPWAYVGVDSRTPVGETPLLKHKVSAGLRKVHVWYPPANKSKAISVRVKGCGHTPITVDFGP